MARLLESGDVRLLESGDARLLEGEGGVIPPTPSTSTLFDDSKGFPSEEYENAIDRITFMMQELEGSLCDCRYIDPVTGLPPVVPCVPLISVAGVYDVDLQGVAPDYAPGESITFSVGLSGTGPYTYQWSAKGVEVVGATGLFFVYMIPIDATSNIPISVEVTNDCSSVVAEYLIQFCLPYYCDAMWETGQVSAEAYWPMTDAMALSPVPTNFFHAGATYGPYDDGLGNEWQMRWTFGSVNPPAGGRTDSIAFDKFNYCETETILYQHYGGPVDGGQYFEVYRNGVKYDPTVSYSDKVTHVFYGDTDTLTMGWTKPFQLELENGDNATAGTVSYNAGIDIQGADIKFQMTDGSNSIPTITVPHGMDTTKPFVVTTESSHIFRFDGTGNVWEDETATFTVSQPGAATITETIFYSNAIGSSAWGVHSNGSGRVSLARGGQMWCLGIAYRGADAHAQISEGLAQNYEDYECL